MDSGKTIAQFIDKELKEKIRTDVQHFKIGNEEDLQQSVYHHLRNFIDDHKLTSIKISGKYTIKGTPIWKSKPHKRTKKLVWKQSQQIMPDLVISEIPQNVKASLNHKIAIELKSTSPGKTHTPSFDTSNYEKDFRKLNALKDYGLLTYYIFIDSDSNVTENTTKEAIKNKEFRVSQRKKQVKKKFNTIVINRFFNPRKKSKQTDDEIKEIRERQMRMFRTYPDDDDPRFSTESKKPKSKSSRKNPNRIAAAKKAWKNSPKLRAKRRK